MRGGDLHGRTPIFSSVFLLCFLFIPVPCFLHPSGPGLLEAGPWEGLDYHFGTPRSFLSRRSRWDRLLAVPALFPEVRDQEEEWGGRQNDRLSWEG